MGAAFLRLPTVRSRTRPTRINPLSFFAPLLSLALLNSASAQQPTPRTGIRDVTPPGTIRVYRSAEDLRSAEAGGSTFDDVRVSKDGTLLSGVTRIWLYGVGLPGRRMICTSSWGRRWACGTAAYVALRNLVEGHTLNCTAKQENGQTIIAVCRIQRADIALSLLRDGWADLAADVVDKPYVDALATAKKNRTGIWGDGPPLPR